MPADILEPMPCVYLRGSAEVVIDGKCRLVDYTYERIVFDIYYRGKYLAIEGKQMSLRCSVKDVTEIHGIISGVSFEEKRKKNA